MSDVNTVGKIVRDGGETAILVQSIGAVNRERGGIRRVVEGLSRCAGVI
jgi:hypothetical protein